MTEAGEKWAYKEDRWALYRSTPEEAEFWIRAFCERLERRGVEHLLEEYLELKRELLGEDK